MILFHEKPLDITFSEIADSEDKEEEEVGGLVGRAVAGGGAENKGNHSVWKDAGNPTPAKDSEQSGQMGALVPSLNLPAVPPGREELSLQFDDEELVEEEDVVAGVRAVPHC